MAIAGRLAAFLALALAFGWVFLRWFERVNLYFPDRVLYAHPGSFGLAYREAGFSAGDGVRLHGWFVEKSPGAPLVILCHGNAGNISNRLEKLRSSFSIIGATVKAPGARAKEAPTSTAKRRSATRPTS